MIKFKRYFFITLTLSIIFVAANILYNLYLDSFGNLDFAYNYKEGLSTDVSNLNKLTPQLTKHISYRQLTALLSEKGIQLNSVVEKVDSIFIVNSGQIRFQFSNDSTLQTVKIWGYNFPSYDSTRIIGSPSISYLFSKNYGIGYFIRSPSFLSLLIISILILSGILSITIFFIKHSRNLNLLILSIFSFLLVIIYTFFTLFFYFNFSFQISPDEILFSHNYINPQYLYEWIISFSRFRAMLFDINLFSVLALFCLLYILFSKLELKK